jgi:signal transduction histidine kinase/DNA-binding response OmpR family regulator
MNPVEDRVNILVVDDLDEKLLVYRTILEELGQNVVTARSGSEALAQVLKTDFAVILLDVQMPDMDGFEAAALIRRRRKSMHTPIIFLTAYSDDIRTSAGYAHGAVDYMTTPVVPEVLRAKVSVFVELHRMTRRVLRQAEERVALAEERSKRSAAEDANRRLALLARAGAVLGRSLDPMVTALDAAKLAIPVIATAAITVLTRPDSPLWATVEATCETDGSLAERAGTRDSTDPALATRVDRVLDGEQFDWSERELILPLRARDSTIGAMILSRDAAAAPFDTSDRTVAEALVARAAIAIDNARLYESIQAADRHKNEFLSMLAHELRNPLAPILNASEILRLAVPDNLQVQWARTIIARQMSHLVRLVDDLLDVSRITSGKIRLSLGPVKLDEVIADAVEASRSAFERAGHVLDVHYPDDAVWLHGDAARLTQVFTNLLNNAAKYTDPGGQVCVNVECEPEQAVIRVKDTGIGIAPDMLHSIFDLFTQAGRTLDRAQGGLGIGLSLVRRLVTKHGGTVSAFSEGPGKGTEITVRLPLGPAPNDPGFAQPVAEADIRNLVILIVDDHVDGAGSLAVLLRTMCRAVYVAHRGVTGLELAMEHRPDAIILDLGLPEMNGYDLAKELRSRSETRRIPLIALSGYGRDEDVIRSRDAGIGWHLVKPVDAVELRRTLELLVTSNSGKG